MNILYVAKHGSGDNDDEGAIAFALRALGHTVTEVPERGASSWLSAHDVPADFMLFHKWPELGRIGARALMGRRYREMPKAFWYFDLVDSKDPTLAPRAAHRLGWMSVVMPMCVAGFCTDGDWVARHPEKLVHLMQGADERYAAPGARDPRQHCPLLFTGMVNHGQDRAAHLAELEVCYGDRLRVFGNNPHERVHGRRLATLLCSADVVLAPNGPQSDRYWSNRVYLTTGFGAFLLHPICEKLKEHYEFGKELIVYHDNHDCLDLIDYFLEEPAERAAVQWAGYQRTLKEHLYRHRCAELIRVVQEKLK